MKTTFKKLEPIIKNLWADEAAQGATEYILLLVVVVGLAMAFKKPMMEMVSGKMDEISGKVKGFGAENN